ncbi:hypothetical protein M3Y96_00613400 [Aphelenchoides besseyi]|nr:hypothetical protein M3Y96_00613400 [Aphelenchoides besseyi]
MSYYAQPSQNPGFQQGFQPQGNNPNYGWNAAQPNAAPATTTYQSVPAFGDDPESGPKVDVNFNDQTIRAAFVRKVFILVGIMLSVVAIMTAIPFFHQPTMLYVRNSPGLYWLSYGTFFVTYLVLMCCESVRRSFPSNLIATAILTLAIGYMTMMITAMYQIESILMCLIITSVCCGGIIVFATVTKRDLTSMIGVVAILGLFVFVFGLVAIVGVMVFHARWMYTLYAGAAALLFMAYLAIDIQMLMGGRKFELSPEDHIFAAIQIFMDIIYIFWMLLSLFGNSNRN